MSAPFRDLFIELPQALFDSLVAIGEEAVRVATAVREPWVVSPKSIALNVWNEAYLYDLLCRRFGWRNFEVWRSASTREIEIGVRMWCGHKGLIRVDEFRLALEDNAPSAFIDAIEQAGRPCFCMQRKERA